MAANVISNEKGPYLNHLLDQCIMLFVCCDVSFDEPKEESLQESCLISDGIASGMDWLLV